MQPFKLWEVALQTENCEDSIPTFNPATASVAGPVKQLRENCLGVINQSLQYKDEKMKRGILLLLYM
ncbi:hypothetical protein [Fulvivirga sediminis]|uniref:Uncharacterized protein n=1 Tax=Fulvivirga sediminis TaxID=2803949 RepID=A0A937FAN0_9BACT|nr:hypothetical protein [Fulvivirga sediminis]MBL3657375.1 hypothetical protein [Fulvivirga sediminis]